jgi:NAD(P)-dependent dehydrogenase (short-subunit alcohol dehydrogenase family)
MGILDGRVAIITGAGRGLGREHALLFAREGARVVVNDLGGGVHGDGADRGPAQTVVDEIIAAGGEAVANGDSVSDWDGAKRLIDQAVKTYGDLHVLVNNAGILRDRVVINMTEQDWDAVMQVHLKGHFCPTRHAATYWREQSKAGNDVKASIIHTSSTSGLLGNAGQANYGAAKAGIAMFSDICSMELPRYGVRSNAIAPAARTRLTAEAPGLEELMKSPDDPSAFDQFDPGNVSPMVAYLASEQCPFNGETFYVAGDIVARLQGYTVAERITSSGERWKVADLATEAAKLVPTLRRGGRSELEHLDR